MAPIIGAAVCCVVSTVFASTPDGGATTHAGFQVDWNHLIALILGALASYFGGKGGAQKGSGG